MTGLDYFATAGAAVATLVAFSLAVTTFRIARRKPERDLSGTRVTIERDGKLITIREAQLLSAEQMAEVMRMLDEGTPKDYPTNVRIEGPGKDPQAAIPPTRQDEQ
ncbi:hypothetical protein [Streptomyces roseolus]|uniref:hypothetical protein n=1 Tax=Streptomyces roseolus TaxID=67358 RepID=UPI00167A6085|nr:hypothetical protein [Streptomyces roseolus]GGR52149.1 hypothetical protein GCM10010282_51470 [Streptomyces roseolus]